MNRSDWPLWKRQLLLLWIGQFLVTLGLTGMTPFLFFHLQKLLGGLQEEAVWWTSIALAVPSASYMVTTPIWGKLGDRSSRKWMVIRALGGLSICMVGMALAPTVAVFLLFRLLQGALGGIYDAATAMLSESAPKERMGEVIGRYQQAVITGSLVGPLVGGWFVSRMGSESFLLMAAVLIMLTGAVCALLLPDGAVNQESVRSEGTAASEGIWQCLFLLWQDRETRSVLTAGILARAMSAAGAVLLPVLLLQVYPNEGKGLAVSIGWMEAFASLGALYGASRFGKASDRCSSMSLLCYALLLCALCVGVQALLPVILLVSGMKLVQGFAYSAVQPLVMRTLLTRRLGQNGAQGVRIGTVNSLLVVGQLTGSLLPLALLPAVRASEGMLLVALLPIVGALLLRATIHQSISRRKEADYAG